MRTGRRLRALSPLPIILRRRPGRLGEWRMLSLLALLAVAAPARAGQIVDPATGSIVGTVRDASGAVVPDVAISVSGRALMADRHTSTGSDGTYQITRLPPGDYTLSFSRE